MLLMGSTRNLVSRFQYEKTRLIVGLCDMTISEWSVLRRLRQRLKLRLNMIVVSVLSPLGTPCFRLRLEDIIAQVGFSFIYSYIHLEIFLLRDLDYVVFQPVQELLNPHVRPHLVTIPELPTNRPINRLSQSKRWRETLEPGLRVQMVEEGNKHFYIYEVLQLSSGSIVVPFFFYQTKEGIFAKCLRPSIRALTKIQKLQLKIPREPAFDSAEFLTVPIKTFSKTFSKIKTQNNLYLKEMCGNNMLCQ